MCDAEEVDTLKQSELNLNLRIEKILDSVCNRKLDSELLLLFASLELESLLLKKEHTEDVKTDTKHNTKIISSVLATIENFIHKVENMS